MARETKGKANMTTETLITIRDYLRYAISQFRKAKLVHGHGTSSVVDEAAFLILETLHLPIDDINPWLDARLLPAEREAVLAIITARLETRKPAAYLTRKTYIHGVPFYVDERVIVPRSYIGELMYSGLFGGEGYKLIDDPAAVTSVLDLCTGSGCLAIIAAGVFPNAAITAADLSADALDVARINIADHDLKDRITLHQGDLFAALKGQRFDLIITNPPYVAEAEVAAFPAEYAHEPVMAHVSGPDGLALTRRILAEAPKHLNPGGGLLCEIGTGRHIIEAEFPQHNFFWLDTEESEGEVFYLTY
jgi:ribosomal protein L3 glutamine methyltransferase